jgi:hypothetical protein
LLPEFARGGEHLVFYRQSNQRDYKAILGERQKGYGIALGPFSLSNIEALALSAPYPSPMSDPDKLHPSRIVYHRGSVVYARLRTGGPDDLRHPLDVPNGAGCGCVCDECNEQLLGCANDTAKVAAGHYKKIPYFAHQSNTQCTPSGERGLMEAFRLVLNSQLSFCLPDARYSLGSGAVYDVIYRTSVLVAVNSFTLTPKVSGFPYELLLKTVQGDYRLQVVTKKSGAAVFEALRLQSIPVLVASMIPDHEGIIYMRDVLNTVQRGDNLAWVSLPEMDAHAADQRKLRETEEKRIRQVEDEKQDSIRIREGIAKAAADMQMKERSRQMDEEAKRLGMIKLLCAACKIGLTEGFA